MLPIELKILKYYFFDQFLFKYKVKKASDSIVYHKISQHLKTYVHCKQFSEHTELSDCSFTIFDLETTGFLPELGNEIISIGAVKIEKCEVQYDDTFYKVLRPLQPVTSHTKQLTGLKGVDFKLGVSFPQGIYEFLQFCSESVLVAHPATFDIPFLQKSITNWKLPSISPTYIDSFAIANFLHGSKRNYLDSLVKHYHIEKRIRHHALNDALMTAEVFVHLLHECQQRSLNTLGDLKKLV
ncbi:3'-5' exonuclease [Bacillus solimangrovi]|uniref:Exonuclease domain-containing protein n=1 Tax=Bacillus solimangrovi TaxID=1305675 RepID=A0A1E5LF37_9BACI|nr:exonuclease domain-containing protein [Bacillus solimangrovi]OEH92695.1 hypothetical protein BFG57_01430 [Bacillus solimangrovi]